jgi:hypothetical protein
MFVDGAEVFWDYQIGTFTGIRNGVKVGVSGGDILSVALLEQRLGVSLGASAGAQLQQDMLAHPYEGHKRYVSKLQFMDLFRPADLEKIYTVAKSSVAITIALDRVNRAPNDQIELTDTRTISQLTQMEAGGLISPGDADRITKGLPWQQ